MARQFHFTHERHSQLPRNRIHKTTAAMAPTQHSYSLRSKGRPSKAAKDKDIDSIEVQLPTNAPVDSSQPLISISQLSAALEEQRLEFTRQLSTALEEQRSIFIRQQEALQTELTNLKTEIATLISTQLSNVYVPTPASPSSYASVARKPPPATSPQPPLSRVSTMSDMPYCTIDISRVEEDKRSEAEPGVIRAAIEKEVRTQEGTQWRCVAVVRDPRNMARIRVACRNEKEQQVVKQAAEKAKIQGARVLRDQLFPVKVDGVNRCAILDESNHLRPEITENLSKENDVHISKLVWLSKKDNQKAYGSMVIYVTNGTQAKRLLQDQFFHVAGESGWTSIFQSFSGPTQCFNCQELGHKAFNCKKTQVCARCAKEGHSHKDCINDAPPKCVPCGGPHESFSRSCRVLHPRSNE